MLDNIRREDGQERLRQFLQDFQNLNTQEAVGTVADAIAFANTPFGYSDFLNSNGVSNPPFNGISVLGGTVQAANSGLITKNHPGVVRIVSSVAANSGYTFRPVTAPNFLIGGGEGYDIVFNPATLTNASFRFGYADPQSITAVPFDGVFFEIVGGAITGRATNNQVQSTTATSFALSTGTWYRARLIVNADATRVDFYLFAEDGSLLWSDYLTTNIPTAVGRETSLEFIVGHSGTTAVNLIHLDYIAYWTAGIIR